MTVTVVQEDELTLSVKDPNKGKHVVYSLTGSWGRSHWMVLREDVLTLLV